jgi:hypothetical protein
MEDWIFPDSLLHLEVRSQKKPAALPSSFPPRLRFLSLSNQPALSLSTIESLPQQLTTLDVNRLRVGDPEGLNKLPRSLLNLAITTSTDWSLAHLAALKRACPDLQRLKMPFDGLEVGNEDQNVGAVELPCSLTELTASNSHWLDPTRLSCLPSTLTTLEIHGGIWFDGICLEQLPRYLTKLVIEDLTKCCDSDFVHLPRGLKTLRLTSTSTFTDACIDYLPPKLTDLKIPTETQFSDGAIARLPRSLSTLICGGGLLLTSHAIANFPKHLGTIQFLACPLITNEYFSHQEQSLSATKPRRALLSFDAPRTM